MRPTCVLIDGRSGAGKTTYAMRLAGELDAQLIHLEDVYPGWGGLAEATDILARSILHPDIAQAGFHPWDWVNDRQSAEWVAMQPEVNLVVEGCGAISAETYAAAQRNYTVLSIDIQVPEEVRKPRALHRSPEMTDFWDMWAEQEEQHRRRMPAPDVVLTDLDVDRCVIPRHLRRAEPQ